MSASVRISRPPRGRASGRALAVEARLPDGLRFKPAQSRAELEAAFALLHDAYVGAGFTRPDPSGLRVTFYQALPSSVTLVAMEGDTVVATVALLRRTALGLPIEVFADISGLVDGSRFVGEISALAIHPSQRGQRRRVLFGLLRYLHAYAAQHMKLTDLFLTCNPRHIDFYESVMLFQRVGRNVVESYDFVDGAPAVGAWQDVTTAHDRFRSTFDRSDAKDNLYRLFFHRIDELPAEWPQRPSWLLADNVWDDDTTRYFFRERTGAGERLSERQRRVLGVAARTGDGRDAPARSHPRAQVALTGTLSSALQRNAEPVAVAVHAISSSHVDVVGIPPAYQLGVAELILQVDGIGTARAIVGPVTDRGAFKTLLALDTDPAWKRLVASIAERLPRLAWTDPGRDPFTAIAHAMAPRELAEAD